MAEDQRLTERRRPSPDEVDRARSALDALIVHMGLRARTGDALPERGALTRLAERIGVSSQRVRSIYAGAVPVSEATLARWARVVQHGA